MSKKMVEGLAYIEIALMMNYESPLGGLYQTDFSTFLYFILYIFFDLIGN